MRVMPSIDDLSAIWRLLVVRAVIILILGIAALPWPVTSITGVLIILATVALVAALFDAAISGALLSRMAGGWALLPEALLGVLLGGAVLLYTLVALGVFAVLLSLWTLVRGLMLLTVARGASSDPVILTLAAGWVGASILAPAVMFVHWDETTLLSIIELLLAYVLVWSAAELAVGLHLRSRARRLQPVSR